MAGCERFKQVQNETRQALGVLVAKSEHRAWGLAIVCGKCTYWWNFCESPFNYTSLVVWPSMLQHKYVQHKHHEKHFFLILLIGVPWFWFNKIDFHIFVCVCEYVEHTVHPSSWKKINFWLLTHSRSCPKLGCWQLIWSRYKYTHLCAPANVTPPSGGKFKPGGGASGGPMWQMSSFLLIPLP